MRVRKVLMQTMGAGFEDWAESTALPLSHQCQHIRSKEVRDEKSCVVS